MWKTPLTFQGIRQLFQHGARNSNVDSVAKFYKNILISMKYLLSQQCVLSSQSECILFKLDMKGRFKPRTMLLQCVHSFQIKYIRQILSCIGYTCEWTSFWLYWKVNHFSGIQTWKESVEILLANCEKKEMKVHETDTYTMAPILPPCVCITNERGVRCFLFIFIPVNI